MNVSIIIPLLRSRPFVPELARSLRANGPMGEVVAVSDGDGRYENLPPEWTHIVLDTNRGFSGAVNAGVAASHGDVLLLLNADTSLYMAGWFDAIARWTDVPSVGLVAPAIIGFDLTISSIGSEWNYARQNWKHIGEGQRTHPDMLAGRPLDRDMVTFACVALRRAVWDEIGPLDEGYVAGTYEDSDYCMRVRERRYRIVVVPASRIRHKIGHSGGVTTAASDANRARYLRTWVDTGRQCRALSDRDTVGVQRWSGYGDVLMALSAVRRVSLLQGARVVLYASPECAGVAANNPDVASVDTGLTKGEVVRLNWAYETRSELHPFIAYGEAMSTRPDINSPVVLALAKPKMYPTIEQRKAAAEWYSARAIVRPLAAIHPGPTWPSRMWPLDRWTGLVAWLRQAGYYVAQVRPQGSLVPGVDEEWRGDDALATAAWLERAALFVGVDSFPSHVAQCMKVPSVILFGGVDPETRLHNAPCRAVSGPGTAIGLWTANLPCSGCINHTPRTVGVVKCPNMGPDGSACMAAITLAQAQAAVQGAEACRHAQAESDAIRPILHQAFDDFKLPYLTGRGMDIGCGGSCIVPEAICVDHRPTPTTDLIHDAQERFPVPDGWFDWIVSSHCLEHLDRPGAALDEWTRILRPGGLLALYLPDERYTQPNPEHKQHYNLEIIEALMKDTFSPVMASKEFKYSFLWMGRKR